MNDPSPTTIRVAILGGGLAGILLLKGLLKYPHIAAEIYESRPSFRDEGPAIELTDASLAALRTLGPATTTAQDLDQSLSLARAGALLTSTEVLLSSGPHSGQVVMPAAGSGGGPLPPSYQTVVGRQALLSELAASLPPRALHFNSRVTAMRESGTGGTDGPILLVLGDGSQKRYDVVIGADRVLGAVARKHVLLHPPPLGTAGVSSSSSTEEEEEEEEEEKPPRPTGFWGLHVTVSRERAQSFLGSEFLTMVVVGPGGNSDARASAQTRWVGDGTFMQHGLVNGGRDVQLVVYARLGAGDDANGSESPWVKLFTPDEFEEMFAGCRAEVCKGIVKLFQSVYTVHIAGFLEMRPSIDDDDGPSSPSPPRDRNTTTTLLTPATSTMPPFPSPSSASTATSLAIEEALILSTLLGRAHSSSHSSRSSSTSTIPAALRAFEAICRPHALRAARAGFETSALLAGCAPGVGIDAGRLAGALAAAAGGEGAAGGSCGGDGGGDEYNVQARIAAAVAVMEQLVGRG